MSAPSTRLPVLVLCSSSVELESGADQTFALPLRQPSSQMAAFSILHTEAGACRGQVERLDMAPMERQQEGPGRRSSCCCFWTLQKCSWGPRTLLLWTVRREVARNE